MSSVLHPRHTYLFDFILLSFLLEDLSARTPWQRTSFLVLSAEQRGLLLAALPLEKVAVPARAQQLGDLSEKREQEMRGSTENERSESFQLTT